MPPQSNNPGTPAAPATEPPAAPPSQPQTPPPQAPPSEPEGSLTPAAPEPPAPQTFSGTWFQEEEPQILIQWTVMPAQAPPSSASPDPGTGSPTYTAQVRMYQQIFDAEFPSPPFRGPVVPFSVMDPSVGMTPFLQGSLVLSPTNPPVLEVLNLRFPGFPSQNLTLYPAPPTSLGTGESGSPTGPAASGDTTPPGTSPSGTSQPPAAGAAATGNPAA